MPWPGLLLILHQIDVILILNEATHRQLGHYIQVD